MNLLISLDLIRLIPLIVVFVFAAKQDAKHGEVTNKLWLYAPIGFVLTIYELTIIPEALLRASLSIISTSAIALLMFYFFSDKGFWGGADTKAIITLALSYPLTPAWLGPVVFFPPIAIVFAGIIVLIKYVKKREKHVRYLPYLFYGIVLASLI